MLTLEVPAGAFSDAGCTASSLVAYRFSQRIATGPVTLTFEFSVDVGDSFSAGDTRPDAGTLSNFTRVSATRYTVLLTLPPATSSVMTLAVEAGGFQSATGVPSQQKYTTGVLFAIPA